MPLSSKQITNMDSLVDMPTYSAGIAQASAYRALKKFTEEAISDHGLTMMQWYIVGILYESNLDEGPSVGDLAAILDTTLPYITNTVNALETRGIVERKPCKDDSRIKRLYLRQEYAPMVQDIEASMRQKMRAVLYKDITPAELLTYVKVLHKLTSALDN